MYIILWDYESVWPEVWPQNYCRSLWPIFHGPVILHYIVKTIWCMNIILWDYELVWPDIWPQNKWRSLWSIFYGPVILPCILKIIWCMNIIIWDYDSVWRYVWTQINVGHCDLYFMVKWFLPYILKTILCMNIIISDYESVWPKVWPENRHRSQWPIFHGPVILRYILWRLLDVWTSYFGIILRPQNKCRYRSSDFVLYLQDYLMHGCYIFR